MTCLDVPTQVKCAQLPGCFWTASSCNGTFNPVCMPPNCYYVDSHPITTTTETGTPDNPVKSISLALNKLANTTGTIIIMNYIDNVTAEVNQTHFLGGGVTTIKPLFVDSFFTLDFSKIPILSVLSVTGFKIRTPAALTVIGGIVSMTSTSTIYGFEIQNGSLTFQNFHIVDSSTNSQLIRVDSGHNSSVFTYDRGSHCNSSLRYTLYGTATLNDIQIINQTTGLSLFTIGGSIVIDGLQVRGSPNISSISIFSLSPSSIFTLKNSILEQGSFGLLSAVGPKQITVINTTFQNITPRIATFIFIKFSGGGTNLIEDCAFINMTMPSSLIIVEQSGNLRLNRVKMTNILKSTVITESIQYANEWAGGLCARTRMDSVLTINSSNFTNIYSHCLGIKESALNISNSIFDNTDLIQPQSLTEEAIISLNDKSGITWVHIQDTTIQIPDGNKVSLTGNKFIRNGAISKYGGAIRLIGVMTTQIYATGNEFIGNTAYYGGAIYSSNNVLGLNLSNNVFAENAAYDGGAIYKKSIEFNNKPYSPSVVINGDRFILNTAIRNGGALLLDWESLCMQGAIFTQCTAQSGGAIYFRNLDKYRNNEYGCLKDSHFYDNSATETGGAMKILFHYGDLNEDANSPATFSNNIALYGEDISSEVPSYYLFSFYDVLVEKTFDELDDLSEWTTNSTRTRFAFSINTLEDPGEKKILQASGHEVPQIIMIEIMNEGGKIIDYISNEQISVDILDYTNAINSFVPFVPAGPIIFTFIKGKIFIKHTLKIVGEPRTTANLHFKGLQSSSNLLKDANLLMDFSIPVYFQDCKVGDIFNDIERTCDTCPAGTYSLSDPYESGNCLKCDDTKVDCLGGAKIAVLPGYWRFNAESVNILQCSVGAACMGGLVDEKYNEQGKCAPEYQGNLCNKCIPNYAKFGASEECIDCSRDGFYYAKLVGFFALKVAVVLYSVKVNMNKIGLSKQIRRSSSLKLTKKLQNTDFQSNLIKIVVNFVQVTSVIVQYKFPWPDFIMAVLNVTNKFIPTDQDSFSIDCFVALISHNNQYIFFIKLVATLLQPFGIWVFLIIGYIILLKIRKENLRGNPRFTKNIAVLFVITSFVMQPSVVQATLEVFKCHNLRDLNNSVYFMAKDTETQCWTSFHIMWSIGIALPFFLLWGVVLPLILLRKLKATKNLQDPEIYSRYAFVYEGLKPKQYYWEFVNLLRKTVMIIIFVFLNVISIQSQAFATFLVILFSAFAHVKCSPYSDARLNRLELFSLVTLGLMSYSGMFFLSGGSSNFTTISLIIIALIFNILFYLATLVSFIISYRQMANKFVRSMSLKISRTLSRDKSRKSYDSDSSISIDKKDKSRPDIHNIGHIFSDVNLHLTEPVMPKTETDHSDIPSEDNETERTDRKTVYNERKDDSARKSLRLKSIQIFRNGSDLSQPELLPLNTNRASSAQNRKRLKVIMNIPDTHQNDSLESPPPFGPQLFRTSTSTEFLMSPNSLRPFKFTSAEKYLRTLNTETQEDNLDTIQPSSHRRLKSEFEESFRLVNRNSDPRPDGFVTQKTLLTEPIITEDEDNEKE